jgi:hypothetical protein
MEAFQQHFMQQQQDMIRKLEQSRQAFQQQRLQQPFAPFMAPHQQAQPVYRYQQAPSVRAIPGSKYTCALNGCKAGPASKKSNKSARRTDRHFDPYGKLSGYALLTSSVMGPLGKKCKIVVPESNLFQGTKKPSKTKSKITFNDAVSVTIIPANETSASQRAADANARIAREGAARAEVTNEMRWKRHWKHNFSKKVVSTFTTKPQKRNPFACIFKMDIMPHIPKGSKLVNPSVCMFKMDVLPSIADGIKLAPPVLRPFESAKLKKRKVVQLDDAFLAAYAPPLKKRKLVSESSITVEVLVPMATTVEVAVAEDDFLAGGNDDGGEALVPPSSPALSIPTDVPTADEDLVDDSMGTQWVNGVRRSARHQPRMGSVFVNGLRRSARRLASSC